MESTNASAPRRRLTFSLGTLFVVLTVMAICIHIGWRGRVNAIEREQLNILQTAKIKAGQDWLAGVQMNAGGDPVEVYYSYHNLCRASIALKDAQLAVETDKPVRIAAVTAHRDRMAARFRQIDALFQAGARGGENFFRAEAEYRLIEAKIWLREEESK